MNHLGSGKDTIRTLTDLQNVTIGAKDLQLIPADRLASLLIPADTGYGAAAPEDVRIHRAIYAEIPGGVAGESVTRAKVADFGGSLAAELIAGLASGLGFVNVATDNGTAGYSFVFTENDEAGFLRWATAEHLPMSCHKALPVTSSMELADGSAGRAMIEKDEGHSATI
jgi:hypothetical protein